MIFIFFSDSVISFSAKIQEKNIHKKLNCYLEYVMYLMLKFCRFPIILIRVIENKIIYLVSENLGNTSFKNQTSAKVIRIIVNI